MPNQYPVDPHDGDRVPLPRILASSHPAPLNVNVVPLPHVTRGVRVKNTFTNLQAPAAFDPLRDDGKLLLACRCCRRPSDVHSADGFGSPRHDTVGGGDAHHRVWVWGGGYTWVCGHMCMCVCVGGGYVGRIPHMSEIVRGQSTPLPTPTPTANRTRTRTRTHTTRTTPTTT